MWSVVNVYLVPFTGYEQWNWKNSPWFKEKNKQSSQNKGQEKGLWIQFVCILTPKLKKIKKLIMKKVKKKNSSQNFSIAWKLLSTFLKIGLLRFSATRVDWPMLYKRSRTKNLDIFDCLCLNYLKSIFSLFLRLF